jgi:hypothetical protein
LTYRRPPKTEKNVKQREKQIYRRNISERKKTESRFEKEKIK